MIRAAGAGDGIGRRSGLKTRSRKAYGFESRPAHHSKGNGVDVKDFVSSTILQIMEGVSEAQRPARAMGGYVNPTPIRPAESGGHVGVTAKGHAIPPSTLIWP